MQQSNKSNKIIFGSNSDDDDGYDASGSVKMYNDQKTVNRVDAFIDQKIQDAPYYRSLLHYLHSMEKDDECTIWLNSPGGYVDSAIQIIDAMNGAEGAVRVIVTGACSSAAGFIALSAPQLIVGDSAYMLCHGASYGTSGKQGDVESMVLFNQKILKDLIRKVYHGFLTPDEIEQMLIGKDFWFDSREMQERLTMRQAIWEEEARLLVEAENSTEVETKVKKPRVSSKK